MTPYEKVTKTQEKNITHKRVKTAGDHTVICVTEVELYQRGEPN